MKKLYLYNTSDVGYMDEEWMDYDPKKVEAIVKLEIVDTQNKEIENEKQTEEI
jgi:hypothetical protein